LAASVAAKGGLKMASVIKQLQSREAQRSTAKKIKYLRGKLNHNSTTMVTIINEDGSTSELTDKIQMEKAIIASKKKNPTLIWYSILQPTL
jgi:hypothetical protein